MGKRFRNCDLNQRLLMPPSLEDWVPGGTWRGLWRRWRTEPEGLRLLPWASRRRQELLGWLDQLDRSVEELDHSVEEAGRDRPGVGPVTGLAFVLTIGPVSRFANSRKLVSYLGLNSSEHSSGGRQRLGAISKQGNRMLRWLLVEAAQTAARLDPELHRTYQRLKFRRPSGVAKVAIARRLAVRMYWMLRAQKDHAQRAPMSGSRVAQWLQASRSRGSDWAPGLPRRAREIEGRIVVARPHR